MTDLTIQKMTADEYHDLVDCIMQGNRIELDEYLEDHSPDNLTTLGQVLLEFFQFHQARMKEHDDIVKSLRTKISELEINLATVLRNSTEQEFEAGQSWVDNTGRHVRLLLGPINGQWSAEVIGICPTPEVFVWENDLVSLL